MSGAPTEGCSECLATCNQQIRLHMSSWCKAPQLQQTYGCSCRTKCSRAPTDWHLSIYRHWWVTSHSITDRQRWEEGSRGVWELERHTDLQQKATAITWCSVLCSTGTARWLFRTLELRVWKWTVPSGWLTSFQTKNEQIYPTECSISN